MAAVDLPAPGRGRGTALGPGAPDPGVSDRGAPGPKASGPGASSPGASGPGASGPGTPVVVGGFSLRVFDAGLACCAVEVSAAMRRCAELLSAPGEGPDLA